MLHLPKQLSRNNFTHAMENELLFVYLIILHTHKLEEYGFAELSLETNHRPQITHTLKHTHHYEYYKFNTLYSQEVAHNEVRTTNVGINLAIVILAYMMLIQGVARTQYLLDIVKSYQVSQNIL